MSDAPPLAGPAAIAWEEPGFANLTWEWDDMHTPRALTRLGRAYVRILADGMGSPMQRNGLPVRWLVRVVDGYAYFARSVDAPEDQHAAIAEAETADRRAQVASAGDWWRTAARPELERLYAEIDAQPLPGAGPDELASTWERAWAQASRAWQIHFLVIDGPYQALDDLVDFVKPRLDGVPEGDILGLASGAIDDLARVEAQLDDLARLAAATPEIAARLVATPSPALDEVRGLPDGDRFAVAVGAFLAEHGHLGHVTEDLAQPSWHVDPRSLLADVGRRMGRDDDAFAARLARRAAAAVELEGRIRTTLADRPDELADFEGRLAAARSIGWLTEGHNYWIDRMCGDRLRRFTRRIGACLVGAGVLDDAEDIRHLERDEVAQLLREPADRRALIAERVTEHDRWSMIIPPATLGKAPAPQEPADADRFGGARYATTDASLLRGTGASAGVVRAIARVVHGPDDFDRVRPGDIVVARASNPGWVPLFAIAGGFVTDTGGVLSHAAVVAREFGVPAVVGTGDATARIEDGRIVEIDGTTGYVRLA